MSVSQHDTKNTDDKPGQPNGQAQNKLPIQSDDGSKPDGNVGTKKNRPGCWSFFCYCCKIFPAIFRSTPTAAMTVATVALAWLAWGASDTSQVQSRAYVTPAVQLKGNMISVTVSNNGQTPALMCCTWVNNVPTDTGAGNEPTQYAREGKPIVIAAGRPIVVTHQIRPLKKGEVLTPSVLIEYDDVFEKHHESTFEFVRDPYHPSELTMTGYKMSDLRAPLWRSILSPLMGLGEDGSTAD